MLSLCLGPDKGIKNKNCLTLVASLQIIVKSCSGQISYILFKIPLGKRKQCDDSDKDEKEEEDGMGKAEE